MTIMSGKVPRAKKRRFSEMDSTPSSLALLSGVAKSKKRRRRTLVDGQSSLSAFGFTKKKVKELSPRKSPQKRKHSDPLNSLTSATPKLSRASDSPAHSLVNSGIAETNQTHASPSTMRTPRVALNRRASRKSVAMMQSATKLRPLRKVESARKPTKSNDRPTIVYSKTRAHSSSRKIAAESKLKEEMASKSKVTRKKKKEKHTAKIAKKDATKSKVQPKKKESSRRGPTTRAQSKEAQATKGKLKGKVTARKSGSKKRRKAKSRSGSVSGGKRPNALDYENDEEIRVASDGRFECRVCQHCTRSIAGIRSHYKRAHDPSRLPAECDLCLKSHTSYETIREHKEATHLRDSKWPFPCGFSTDCGAFETVQEWRDHFTLVHGFFMPAEKWANFEQVKLFNQIGKYKGATDTAQRLEEEKQSILKAFYIKTMELHW